jgi:4-hydroxymandelate oxidase
MDRWAEQLEELARAAMPEAVHRYVRQGSRDGVSVVEAREAWERVRFLPRILRDVTEVDTVTELLGTPVRAPFAIAPTTMQRAVHPDGEVAMARAAAANETLMVLSSNAGTTFEEVAATGVAWWLQMYVPSDRVVCEPLLERATRAGARAIVLTADTPVVGTKYDGGQQTVWDIAEPSWLHKNFHDDSDLTAGRQKAMDLGPQDIDWLTASTGLPVVVKGVLRHDDARRCVEAGAAGVWVSNHGGRQLDRAAAPAECLRAVVEAVGDRAEVYVDGGVRSGRHGFAALALGATGVFLGRSPLYALAVDGQAGVERLLAGLAEELVETMRLAGCNGLHAVSPELLLLR